MYFCNEKKNSIFFIKTKNYRVWHANNGDGCMASAVYIFNI